MNKDQLIRVLVVDDDEEDFLITRDIFSDIVDRRYQVDWVSNYQQGLQAIREGQHDVYLIDYRLGSDTGVELISEAIREGVTAPMILLTGQGTPEIDDMAMRMGAADFLTKGIIDSMLLDRTVRYAIKQYRVLEEVRRLNAELEERVEQRTAELNNAVHKLEESNASLEQQIRDRKRAEDALRESQRLYMTIARNYPNGVIAIFDRDFRYVFVEGKGLVDIGLNQYEMTGQRLMDRFDPAKYEEYTSQLMPAFYGETSHFEINLYGRDYMINAVPIQHYGGEVTQILMVTQDISDRKQAEEEVRRALAKERDLGELKSRFVSMASHEFRTPLGTILSSATLISKYNRLEDEEKRMKHINRIKTSVSNLTEILNDFLSLGRLEEGKIYTRPERLNIAEFGEEVKEIMHVTVKEGQEIVFRHAGQNEIIIDKQLLKNISINLLSNAIKYSPEFRQIFFETEVRDNTLLVKVQDQGIGIPERDQVHIFDTFFRAHNVTNIQGTGLGLNIVKKYLDLLGGTISFKSEQGQGTTFYLSIPENRSIDEENIID